MATPPPHKTPWDDPEYHAAANLKPPPDPDPTQTPKSPPTHPKTPTPKNPFLEAFIEWSNCPIIHVSVCHLLSPADDTWQIISK